MNSASLGAASLFEKVATYATTFRTSVGDRPQRPQITYQEALQTFEAPTPEIGTPADLVLSDLVTRASPGLNAMTGPRFFGWVIGASHPVGVAADWLTSVWGQNAGNHTAAPAAAAVETIATRWLLDLLDLPRQASVGFVTGATVANLVCLAAARGEVLRRVGWDVEARGLFGALTVLLSAVAANVGYAFAASAPATRPPTAPSRPATRARPRASRSSGALR
jgi:glutamate/tyrosine decarboxylase-like PLP-dependent enzyme